MTRIGADNSGITQIHGDVSGTGITKTISHEGVTSTQLWTEIQLLRQKCDTNEANLRGLIDGMQSKVNNIQAQRINDMRRLLISGIAVLLLLVTVMAFSLMQPVVSQDQHYGVYAMNEQEKNAAMDEVNAGIIDNLAKAPLFPRQGEHCLYPAQDSKDAKPYIIDRKTDCFPTIEEAVAELDKRTGTDNGILLGKINASGSASAAVAVHYSGTYYTGGSVIIYGGHSGCYGGNQWWVFINWTVNSAITIGGCNTQTLYTGNFDGWSITFTNKHIIGLQPSSAHIR